MCEWARIIRRVATIGLAGHSGAMSRMRSPDGLTDDRATAGEQASFGLSDATRGAG